MADRGALSTALALLGQYGDDAEIIATLRAAEYAAMGDLQGLAEWDRIIALLSDMSEGAVPPGQLN